MFRRKKKNDILEQAIEFIKTQKELNKKNMKTIQNMNYDTDDMKEWDKIYGYVIDQLKNMRK